MVEKVEKYNVVDLFSGAGGMSFGFHEHSDFRLIAAADAEYGKPSSGVGKLQCNVTYMKNIGIQPVSVDLSAVPSSRLREVLGLLPEQNVDVLSTCPPCTGFTRTNPNNHLVDDKRNSLVRKSAEFAVALDADVVVMENARELIRGNFSHHYEWFREFLEAHGYSVCGKSYMLTEFGLPQIRERAIVIAVKQPLPLYTLESLWNGWCVDKEALTVRRAFNGIDKKASGVDVFPSFSSRIVSERISKIPKDGGSWMDLLDFPVADVLLTPSMKRIVAQGRIGSYPDVYGRMKWSEPAPTIKRECSHVGNGRYAHPREDRLCSVREMAILQGFPNNFVFGETAVSNLYRHIGDAVPPMIAYQLAHLCHWILTGKQPAVQDSILHGTHLKYNDLLRKDQQEFFGDCRVAECEPC